MAWTLTILTILPALTAVGVVARAGPRLRGTSLRLALGWALAASLAVATAWLATNVGGLLSSPWDDIAWYIVAVLLLCPPIAVLGARRPGVAVWNWFVLLPLIAVLAWPVTTAIAYGAAPASFALDTPLLLGVLLVLVMGCGNYLATRFQTVALLLAFAVVLLLVPLVFATPWPAAHFRLMAVWSIGFAALAARQAARHPGGAILGPARIWQDFRDQFGIVWAQRVLERVNERALQEGWPVRLERQGFVARTPPVADACTDASDRIDHTLRWLLRRFVDDAWIDRRSGAPPN